MPKSPESLNPYIYEKDGRIAHRRVRFPSLEDKAVQSDMFKQVEKPLKTESLELSERQIEVLENLLDLHRKKQEGKVPTVWLYNLLNEDLPRRIVPGDYPEDVKKAVDSYMRSTYEEVDRDPSSGWTAKDYGKFNRIEGDYPILNISRERRQEPRPNPPSTRGGGPITNADAYSRWERENDK